MRFILSAAVIAFVSTAAVAKPSIPTMGFDNDGRSYHVAKSAKVKAASNAKRRHARNHRKVRGGVVRNHVPAVPSVYAVAAPARFIGGRLICAVNVNAALAARGIAGTGSRLAKSFLRWGRPTAPVPGAVAIFNRGRNARSGHVAIVKGVLPDGRIVYFNPSSRHGRWVETIISRRPIAFRAA